MVDREPAASKLARTSLNPHFLASILMCPKTGNHRPAFVGGFNFYLSKFSSSSLSFFLQIFAPPGTDCNACHEAEI